MFGRGSTDDKGPVLCWINSIEAFQQNNIEVPVNIKFVFEGMEESGSEGLDDALFARLVVKVYNFYGFPHTCTHTSFTHSPNPYFMCHLQLI